MVRASSHVCAVLPPGSKLFMAHGSEKRGGVAVWVNRKLADAVELIGVSRAPIGMERVWLRIKVTRYA